MELHRGSVPLSRPPSRARSDHKVTATCKQLTIAQRIDTFNMQLSPLHLWVDLTGTVDQHPACVRHLSTTDYERCAVLDA